MVFAPLAKASPANRKRISWEMSKLVFARSGANSEYVLCFLYRYSFVKFDVSLSSALWTNTIRFVGHKLITGLSELRWTSPESIYEEISGRVCGLKKISGFWGKFFSCLPKKTQCKSQNCSLRARKENLRAIFGKKFLTCSSAPHEQFWRMLWGTVWHLVGNCVPCVRRKDRRKFKFSDILFQAFVNLRREIFSKLVRTSF